MFKGWHKYSGNTWTWESKEQKGWSQGSSKTQSVPVKLEERQTDPVEQARERRDIGDANVDPAFLYPASDDNRCPVPQSRKMSKQESKQYIQWIMSVVPELGKKKKGERVYCAYCDTNNHPRFSHNHFYKQPSTRIQLQSTLAHCVWAHIHLFYALELKSTMVSPSPTGQGERSSRQLIIIELQIFDGVQMVFHRYHLLSNHLKKDKMQHHFVQRQLQSIDHLQAAHVQCRIFDNLQELALPFMKSKNGLNSQKRKRHIQGQAIMCQATCGTLTSK